MPDPRPLGSVARSVLHSVSKVLEDSQDAIFDVMINVHGKNAREAIIALKEVAARNNTALRVITLLLAHEHKDAEDVLIQAKLRKNASNSNSNSKEPGREKQP